MGRTTKEDVSVFEFIDTKGGDANVCWPWTGKLQGRDQDRGYIMVAGVRWLAYRLVYTMFKGPIPDKHVVRHMCDNPICCNPHHLELGTQSDNEKDKYKRDRAGLPVAVVREIKRLLDTTSYTQAQIAAVVSVKHEIPVSREAVKMIKAGHRRADIDDAKTAEEILNETMKHVLDKPEEA